MLSGMCCDYFSTLVRTGGAGVGGTSLLMIPKNLEGVTVRKMKAQGWWAGNTTMVGFEGTMVPVENLIGTENKGFKMMATVMNGERLIAAQGAVRQARLLLQESIKYARERNTFGKKLIEHQVSPYIRHMLKYDFCFLHFLSCNSNPSSIGDPP